MQKKKIVKIPKINTGSISPLSGRRIAAVLVITIFLCEFLIMVLGFGAFLKSGWLEAFADSILLSILSIPVFYYTVVRPISVQSKNQEQAEKALRESEQLLNFHINNSPLATIQWDSDFIVTRWSGEAEKIFGWKSDETLGMSLMDLKMIYEEDIQSVNNTIEQLLKGTSKYVIATNRNYTKTGKVIVCEWYNTVLSDPQGKMISIMSQVLDITERKLTEKLLTESEALLAESQRIAKIGSWEWDMISGKVKWSKGMFQVFDIDPANFDESADLISKIIHPDDLEIFTTSMKDNLLSGNSPTLEYRIIHRDKSVHTILAEGRNYFDVNGVPVRNIGTAQDITERKEEQYNSTFLSNAVLELIQFKTPMEIFKYTVNKLYSLLSESVIITAVEYDNQNNKWKMAEIKGINSFIDTGLKKIGIDLRNFSGEINTQFLADVEKGKLVELEFDLHALTNGKISGKLNSAVKKIIPINELFIIPIKKEEIIYGTVTLIITKTGININKQLIEAFIAQVSVFIEKLIIENELKENENKLKAAEEIAHVGNYEIDIKTGKAIWSEETFRIFGLEYQKGKELTAYEYGELLHPDDTQKLYETFEKCIAEVKTFNLVYRIIRTDNEVRYVHSIGELKTDEAGIPVKMFGTFQDITELTKEREALVASEKKYRLMFHNLNVGFALHEIILDNKGKPCDYRFLEINPAFENLTGLQSKDLIGKTIMEVLPDNESYWIDTYGKVALKDKTINFENYSKPLGKYFQVSAYSPETGKFATIFIDVTERKRAEEERHLANEMQEKLLSHITEIRENERALISREIHDQLGQSLTALKLDINWLQAHASDANATKEKLKGMVDIISSTIKDVQRISSELRPGILDDLGLAAAIEWYAEEFEKRSGLQVELDLDEILIQDEKTNLALFRVMQESLTNVVRHAHAKAIKLTLHEINEHAVLDIEDDGVGISIEKLKSIHSLGIMSMHDRIKQVNGTLDILCGSAAGTKLRICVPLETTMK